MKHELEWSAYQDQGMGDAYADIPRQGGNFAKAVAVCIRSGVCQQPSTGVMCPSFRISDDPRLSPGGRVVQLKQALNHADPAYWLDDPEVARLLDSCVSCKGCQRECENNLDMAAIKLEYLAQQRKRRRFAPRAWLFAHFPQLLHHAPWLGQAIRWRNRMPWLARLTERVLGITAAYPLPEPAVRPFAPLERWFAPLTHQTPLREVVLWVDSLTSQFAPEQAQDVLLLLRALGYRVRVIHPGSGAEAMLDSGRLLLSQGYVDAARQQAQALLAMLEQSLHRGLPILGLEPSALLMLRDEYRQLVPSPLADLARQQAVLLEEFLAHELQAGRCSIPFLALPVRLLVHGHCHQKASGAMKSLRRVLRLIPELDFTFIEASCCGMAGTFGLEREHLADSLAMAELALLPALAAEPQARVLCNGMACRQQISRLTGRQPCHLASLLVEALGLRSGS
jgi:glycerol-3-phosphate dehydrogenase subunit C